ncbi:GntR family transcriptional regulator [Flindersiella endophytica]
MNAQQLRLPSFGDQPSLRDRVTEALRAALISGEMRPGEVYSAPVLAARFGVSATPVREAMLDLVKQGLVETVRNKGFRVRELSDTELDEITHLRELIEVPTVKQLAKTQPPSAFEALRPLAAEIVDSAAEGNLIAYLEADRRFHLELLALAGNRRLVELVDQLRGRSRLYGLQSLADRGVLVDSAKEHLQLLDLLLAGDAKGAADLMRRHVAHLRGSWAGRPEA